jgi:uncharacterized protein YbjT (DUF2867 family)
VTSRTWLITGVSSGFGRELTTQLLDRGDTVVGTVRRPDGVADLAEKHPDTLHVELLDVTDPGAVRALVDRAYDKLGRIDVCRQQRRLRAAEYDGNPAHAFQAMLDPASPPAPGDPARMATRIIDSVDIQPVPLRMVLGSQALDSTLAALRKRIADFETQTELAASTDYPPGE